MKYSFFNSVNYDRAYSAEDWADYFKHFIGNGVYAQPDTAMQIVSTGDMGIKCLDGSCFINGYTGTASEIDDTLTLEMGDYSYGRYDTIVARLDLNSRDIHIDVIQGIPAEDPEKPAPMRTEMIYDLVLAYVFVGVGATEITDVNIEDARFYEDVCGVVKGVVNEITTGELFKQYAAEWAFLMATMELDEPAIMAKFDEFKKKLTSNLNIAVQETLLGSFSGGGTYELADSMENYDFVYIIQKYVYNGGKYAGTQIIPKYLLSDYYVTDEISYNFSHYTQGNARYLLLGATQIKTLSTYAVDVYGLKLILKSEVAE